MEGTCGGGPEGAQYRSRWHIKMNDHEHFFIGSEDGKEGVGVRERRGTRVIEGMEFEMEGGRSPVSEMYHRLSGKRGSLL